MKYFKRFILMIQFLTTIPMPVSIDCTEEDYGKGLVFAPIIGLMIGGIMVLLHYLITPFFPPLAVSVMILVSYVLLTGGIHLDGLGDSFDGLFSNRPKERMLEIMSDSRVGTNAVLALISILLLNFALLNSLDLLSLSKVLVLFPVAGRIGSLISAGVSSYAREGEGLGKSFINYCTLKEVFIGATVYAVIFYVIWGFKGLVLALITSASALLCTKFFTRKIGGATGDILGAVCELNQTIFLLMVYFVIYFM
ncbi:MAG: adenosylcobinamide-GDP ribazoletransferase [Bacillota bacterium]